MYDKTDINQYLERFEKILCDMATKMLSQKTTNNITYDFIKCMIPHHQAAIYMCENLLNYTKYKPLIEIANNIIKMQSSGIMKMQEILNSLQGYANNKNEVMSYTKEYLNIVNKMIFKMKNSCRSNNIDLDFTSEMIPHHEGAIRMCNNLLRYNIDPRLRIIANSIIEEQTKGVEQLRKIRNDLCFKKNIY